MKKAIKIVLVLIVLAVLGYFGYQLYLKNQTTETTAQAAYTQARVTTGTLTKSVTGTGSISIAQTQSVALAFDATIESAQVEAGAVVSAGDALLKVDTAALKETIASMETELSDTVSSINSLVNSMNVTGYIKSPVSGRVKAVYMKTKNTVEDIMTGHGAILLLSLDKTMTVQVPATDAVTVGATVSVRDGETRREGTVMAVADGMATVTFSDETTLPDTEVEVRLGNDSLGTGKASISKPYLMTSTQNGMITYVYVAVNDRVWENKNVAYLTHVTTDSEYDALENTREKLQAKIDAAKALLAQGVITSPIDGIVSSIVAVSQTAQAASSELCTLYVGDSKQMIVSVDELDIINVKVGQNVSIAMDAITDKTYSATVSNVSQIGTSSSGVTVYDVTLSIEGDDQLKIGMNGTATIFIEEVKDALLVPISALNTSRNGQYVWLYSEGQAESSDEPGVKTYVTTGLSNENYAQVTEGLKEGDVVLITRSSDTSSSGNDFKMDMGGGMMDFSGAMPSGGDMPSMPSSGNAPSGGQGGGRTGGTGGGNR